MKGVEPCENTYFPQRSTVLKFTFKDHFLTNHKNT
jgi:hypothetical protein